MAQLSKQALKVGNNTSFPNNNTNYITPAILREFNTDMIDSLVDENTYNVDSASWNADIAAISASATVNTGSLLLTASVNLNTITFTKGDASQFAITVDTGSGTATDISALNAFTQSQDSKNSTLATYTASVDNSITALNSSTASLFTSASLSLVTASFDNANRNLTFNKGDGTTFAVNIPDVSGSAGDFVTTSSFNAYTSSNDQRVSSLEAATSSYVTSAITASSIITASVNNDDITFTKGDGSQFTIQVATGSFAATASLAQDALDIVVNVKNTTGAQIDKGTVVRIIGATGDNPLIQTASWENDANSANTLGFVVANIPNDGFGRVITQGTLLSIDTDPALGYAAGQLVYLSSSGQYTNVVPPAPYHEVRLGQVLRAQQNNGSIYVLVQNGYELSELHDVNINTGSLVNNDLLAYNSASGQWENKTLTQVGAATTGSNTFIGDQTISGSIFVSQSKEILLGDLQVGSVYKGMKLNTTSDGNVAFNMYGTGSADFHIGVVQSDFSSAHDLQLFADYATGILFASIDTNFSYSPFMTIGNGVGESPVMPRGLVVTGSVYIDGNVYADNLTGSAADLTELNAFTASQLLINVDYDLFTASADSRLGNLEAATGSYLITASINNSTNTITFTKADTSTFDIIVQTGSISGIDTGSFATTGSNSFQGAQEITGGLNVTEQIFTNANITVNQASNLYGTVYAYAGAEVSNNLNVYGVTNITGSLTVTGSAFGNVVSMSIDSNTASMDLAAGNYFTLTLADSTDTHITATNIQPGLSATLVVTTGTDSSASLAPMLYQPSGSLYTASFGSGKQDILSLVSVGIDRVYVVSTKDMIGVAIPPETTTTTTEAP